jgi:hypothetical protein
MAGRPLPVATYTRRKSSRRQSSKSVIHSMPMVLQTSGTFRLARCAFGRDTSRVTTTRSGPPSAAATRNGSRVRLSNSTSLRSAA